MYTLKHGTTNNISPDDKDLYINEIH